MKNSSTLRFSPAADDERGVILILSAIFIVIIILFVVFTISINEWSQQSMAYRTASNNAAVSASATLCSTRKCYNQVLINALLSIQKLQLRGQTGVGTLDAQITAAIAALNLQVTNNQPYLTSPNGNTEWIFDGVRVRIQRGRWWTRGYNGPAHCSENAADNALSSALIPASAQYTEVPTTPSAPVEAKFEPFDRFDGVNWQTCDHNKGTPNFLAANAVRVTIDIPNFKSSLYWTGLPVAQLAVDAVSARITADPVSHKFCGSPFAIPACALVDQNGEYNPSEQCQFNRFFTDVNRYCTQAEIDAGTCDVLPGSWYDSLTPKACSTGTTYGSTQKCECYNASLNDVESPYSPGFTYPPSWIYGHAAAVPSGYGDMYYNAPCAQELGQGNQECTFFPWPKQGNIADHYGVVGASVQALQNFPLTGNDKTAESFYRNLMGMANACYEQTYIGTSFTLNWYDSAMAMAIGDDFYIKPAGLTEAATDMAVWRRIYGRSPGNDALRQYPRFYEPQNWAQITGRSGILDIWGDKGFRELGLPWFMGRVDDARGYPVGETKNLLDQIKAYAQLFNPPHLLDDYVTVPPYKCLKAGIHDYGTCNSHRSWYNNRCNRVNKRWNGKPPADGSTNFQLRKVSDYLQASDDPYGFDWEYQDPNSGNFTCSEVPPYMPCNIQASGGYAEGYENAPAQFFNDGDYPAWGISIWHTNAPVIADTSPTATACKGVGGSAADPKIDPSHDWKVIGFVRMYIFDNDIGVAPPQPPGPSYGSPEPQVCDYGTMDFDANGIPDRFPWRFNPTYRPPPVDANGVPTGPPQSMGAPANCNMVRSHIACENGLISGDYRGMPMETKPPPALVYLN